MNMLNPFTAALEATLVEDPRVLSKASVDELTNYEPAGWLAVTIGCTDSASDRVGNKVVACVRCACLVADTPQSRAAHDSFHERLGH